MTQGKEIYGAIWIRKIQPLPSLTVWSQVGKVVDGMSKTEPIKLECLWWTNTLKGKYVEVKRKQSNKSGIVPSGRNPKEIKIRAKAPKCVRKPMLHTHKTMSGVSVTKRWAKEKYDLTKTKLDVTPTQGETVALLQGERQPICALALFRSLLSHTLAYKLE